MEVYNKKWQLILEGAADCSRCKDHKMHIDGVGGVGKDTDNDTQTRRRRHERTLYARDAFQIVRAKTNTDTDADMAYVL